MINVAKEFIDTQLNKDQRGKLTPSEFNTVARAALTNVTANLLEELRKVTYRELRGGHGANLGSQTEFSEQIVEHYITEPTRLRKPINKQFPIPKDCRSIVAITLPNGTEIEKLTVTEFHRIINTKHGKPTKCYPVYTRTGQSIKISPFLFEAFISYIRIPKIPKWTYSIVLGQEIFDSTKSDFQDLDLPYDLFDAFLIEALKLCGISIRENDIAQIMMNEQQIDIQTNQ